MSLNFLCVSLKLAICLQVTSSSGQLLKARSHQIDGFTKRERGIWNGSYIFVQGTDPQPGLISQIKGGDGTKWDEDIRLLERAVSAINDMKKKPKFFFITGDIINAFPGDEPYRTEQTKDVLNALSKIEVPTMVISGNHDLQNTPTPDSIELFRKQYGDDYYSFYCGGVAYIALNSQYFFDSSQVGDLAQEQIDWLDNELNQVAQDSDLHHVVIFMHIPLFLQEHDEEDNYFSISKLLRMQLLDKFMNANVEIVFSGHYHRNAGGIWRKTVDGKEFRLESVVSSAIGAQLGKDESGLRIVQVSDDQITHKYVSLDDMTKVPLLSNDL